MTKHRKRRHESGTPEKGEDNLSEAVLELKKFIETKTGEAVEEITKKFDQRMVSFEESLNFAYESITATSKKLSAAEKEIHRMNIDIEKVQSRLALLEQEKEEEERNKRLLVLIFSGEELHLPESSDRLDAVISAVINRYLELDVRPGQIIGTKRISRNRVLVKFVGSDRGSLRDLVFRAKGKLRGHKIYINENLTPTRQEAFNMLLHYRRQGCLATVLTHGGEVLFACSRGDKLIRVRNKEEVEMYVKELQDSSPVPHRPRPRSAGPDPAPGGSYSADGAVAAPGTRESRAAFPAYTEEPGAAGEAARRGQLEPPLAGRGDPDLSAGRRDATEVEGLRPRTATPVTAEAKAPESRPGVTSMPRAPDPGSSAALLSGGWTGASRRPEAGGPDGGPPASPGPARTESGRTARGETGGTERSRRPSSVPTRSTGAGRSTPMEQDHLPSARETTNSGGSRGAARAVRGRTAPQNGQMVTGDGDGPWGRDIRSYWK